MSLPCACRHKLDPASKRQVSPLLPEVEHVCLGVVCAQGILTPFSLPHLHYTNSVLWGRGQGQARAHCWFSESLSGSDLISQYKQSSLCLNPEQEALIPCFGMRLVTKGSRVFLHILPRPKRRHFPWGLAHGLPQPTLGPRPGKRRHGCYMPNLVWETLKEPELGTSLVVQWLRSHLAMQKTQV